VDVSLIVNAGGQSRRMGEHKALLRLPDNGPSLLAHILARLSPLVTGKIVVVANQPALAVRAGVRAPVQVVGDLWPQAGALGGIATGLHYVEGWAMCVACDMPFVNRELMAYLLKRAYYEAGEHISAVLPVFEGRLQPFHAVYHAELAEPLAQAVEAGERRVITALKNVRALHIDIAEHGPIIGRDAHARRAFWNANTPAEWAQAQAWLAEVESGESDNCPD
jgi:molybdenum cofactor guanylyltransferase